MHNVHIIVVIAYIIERMSVLNLEYDSSDMTRPLFLSMFPLDARRQLTSITHVRIMIAALIGE